MVHDDADDVLQLTYVRIYKGLGKFAFKSTVKTWCYRIAYNEAMRYLESNNKRIRLKEEVIAYRLENLYADPYLTPLQPMLLYSGLSPNSMRINEKYFA